MSCVYVTEQGAKISVGNGKLIVECKNNLERHIALITIAFWIMNLFVSGDRYGQRNQR